MRFVSFLLISLLAIGCGKNASQPAASVAPGDDEDDDRPPVAARQHFGTPVVFSADGKFALSGTCLYDLATGKLVQQLQDRLGTNSCALSPDGKTALSANREGTVTLWNVATGKVERTFLGHHDEVDCVVFFPDGKRALSGGRDGTIRVWELATGAQLQVLSAGDLVSSLAISPNGRLAASVCGPFRMWDMAKGEIAWEFGKRGDAVSAAAFSPDGKRVVLGGKRIRVCEAVTGNLVTLLDLGVSVWSVAFLPDSEHILTTGEDGLPRLWDLKDGRIEQTYPWRPAGIGFVAACSDSKRALFESSQGVILFDLDAGEEILPLVPDGPRARVVLFPGELAFSPDGKLALTSQPNRDLVLWDVATGKPIRKFTGLGGSSLAFCPNGKWAIKEDRGVTVWDVRTGKEIWSREGNGLSVGPCIFSPDSSLVLLTSPDGPQICNLRTGEVVGPPLRSGHGGAAFLPDGKRILTWTITDADVRTVETWDLTTRQRLNTSVIKPVRGLHITPTGEISVDSVSRITLWDTETGRSVRVIAELDRDSIEWAVFSPDARLLLWSGRFAPLQVTDVTTSRVVRVVPWKGNHSAGWALAFSPDGRLVRFKTKTTAGPMGREDRELTRLQLIELGSLDEPRRK